MSEDEARDFGKARELTNSERLKSLLAAREVWNKEGFSVSKVGNKYLPLTLANEDIIGSSLDIQWGNVFPKAQAWNPLYGFKTPRLNITLENGPLYGPLKRERVNRFFSIETREQYTFPNSPEFFRLRGWSRQVHVIRANPDPFGWNRDIKAAFDEGSKVAIKQAELLVEKIMAAGRALTHSHAAHAPSNQRMTEHPKEGGSRTKFSIGETHSKTYTAILDDWKKNGIPRPKKNLILTETEPAAEVLNRLAQRERLKAGILGRDSMLINNCHIHQNDRVRFAKHTAVYGVRAGETGTVTNVTAKKLSIFLDGGRVVRISPKEYQTIELAYAMTHDNARQNSMRRAFILFEGTNPAVELDHIRRREWSSKVKTYAEVNAAQRGFNELEKRQGQNHDQTKSQQQSHEHRQEHSH